jgi:hypothetical protein
MHVHPQLDQQDSIPFLKGQLTGHAADQAPTDGRLNSPRALGDAVTEHHNIDPEVSRTSLGA